MSSKPTLRVVLEGGLSSHVAPELAALVESGLMTSLASQDATLWGPEAEAEASIRMGWISSPLRLEPLVAEVLELRESLAQRGIRRVILCGMGGSSLAPEVMAAQAALSGLETNLRIVDSTHPDQLAPLLHGDLSGTVVVVASKSGGTLETDSARRAFEAALVDQGLEPREQMVVVTDPDSPLHHQAVESGYRVFLGDPTIGGRFSALSPFGLVPSGLCGVDIHSLVIEAEKARVLCVDNSITNPALVLGAAIATGHPQVNKLLLGSWADLPGFGDWIEQLVAESTGKNGVGLLPVVDSTLVESTLIESALGDSTLVDSALGDLSDCLSIGHAGSGSSIEISGSLGPQIMLWEFATAVACHLLGVNPFDQPNVESAKIAAKGLLEATELESRQEVLRDGVSVWSNYPAGESAATLEETLSSLLGELGEHSYLALCIFGNQTQGGPWSAVRDALEARTHRPVTVGFGPRFLHSTGQLHKGGAKEGVFLQVIEVPEASIAIPGRDFDFGTLILAQAHGDAQVLAEHGQRVCSVSVDSTGRAKLLAALDR